MPLDIPARVQHTVSMEVDGIRIQLRNAETGYAEVWDRDADRKIGSVRRSDMTDFWEALLPGVAKPVAGGGNTRAEAVTMLVRAVKGSA